MRPNFRTPDGAVTLVDFMPPRAPLTGDIRPEPGKASDVVRIVRGKRGQLAMSCELILRFDYGQVVPWVTRLEENALRAVAGPNMTVLRTPVSLKGENFKAVGNFIVSEGDTVPFVLSYGRSYRAPPNRSTLSPRFPEPRRSGATGCRVAAKLAGGRMLYAVL